MPTVNGRSGERAKLSRSFAAEKEETMRTGITAFVRLILAMCRLLDRYRPTIEAVIAASSMSAADKERFLSAIALLDGSCRAIRVLSQQLER